MVPSQERELGPGTVQLLRSIKNMLDPTGFMNPGTLLLPEGESVATQAH
jgi:FAD/FMN-containing dehydrogenase